MNVHRLKVVDPAVKWKVKRTRPYGGRRQALTHDELDRLFAALKGNRHGHRDYMIALMTFLHGLRVSELIDLRWDDVDFRKGTIAIRHLKGSIDGTHYLERDEAVGLKRAARAGARAADIFTSERGQAFSRFAHRQVIAPRDGTPSPGGAACLRHTPAMKAGRDSGSLNDPRPIAGARRQATCE